MNISLLMKSLGWISVLVICTPPSYAKQLTTQELLNLSIEELMEVKVVEEAPQGCQQVDTLSKIPRLPPKPQNSRSNKISSSHHEGDSSQRS